MRRITATDLRTKTTDIFDGVQHAGRGYLVTRGKNVVGAFTPLHDRDLRALLDHVYATVRVARGPRLTGEAEHALRKLRKILNAGRGSES